MRADVVISPEPTTDETSAAVGPAERAFGLVTAPFCRPIGAESRGHVVNRFDYSGDAIAHRVIEGLLQSCFDVGTNVCGVFLGDVDPEVIGIGGRGGSYCRTRTSYECHPGPGSRPR
jgi:hypothetical protein